MIPKFFYHKWIQTPSHHPKTLDRSFHDKKPSSYGCTILRGFSLNHPAIVVPPFTEPPTSLRLPCGHRARRSLAACHGCLGIHGGGPMPAPTDSGETGIIWGFQKMGVPLKYLKWLVYQRKLGSNLPSYGQLEL